MMGSNAAILPGGERLHLQHGPIDLIIGVDQHHQLAFDCARDRFQTILNELVSELPDLRQPLTTHSKLPQGRVAQRMHLAAEPFSDMQFMTRMAAVAGAVADEILQTMIDDVPVSKAYVNNGGDVALYLQGDAQFSTMISSHDGYDLGRISLTAADGIGGIATSGRHGRSFSLGIADSVTVLAKSAAQADAAATLIANAVDLPDHPSISRHKANELDPDSDLGARLAVTDCGSLSFSEKSDAVDRGSVFAHDLFDRKLIEAAAIFLQGESCLIGTDKLAISERAPDYA